MITKSLIAAAAVAASLTALAPVQQAQAKVNIDFNIVAPGIYGPATVVVTISRFTMSPTMVVARAAGRSSTS